MNEGRECTFADLGIAQRGEDILLLMSRPMQLPRERQELQEIVKVLRRIVKEVKRRHKFRGVGIAAPQLRILKQVFVASFADEEPRTFVNPHVIDVAQSQNVDFEGCLSFFQYRGKVIRPDWVDVGYFEEGGQWVEERFERRKARLVLHEIDHLNGILYTARMPMGEELITLREYRERRGVVSRNGDHNLG